MTSLQGRVIALLEGRRAAELERLVMALGGVPLPAPAVREVPCADRAPARTALGAICDGAAGIVVFLTGVGARAFLGLAAEVGRRADLLAALAQALVVARGPKAAAALREAGVRVDVLPEEPTSESVLRALAGRELPGVTVALQLAGDDSPALVEGLRRRGATVLPVQLYEWVLPDDQAPLERAVREIAAGRVHAVAFTSAPQVRHLWLVAGRLGLAERLAEALRGPVAAAVVGPVCRAALVERGVTPRVEPRKPVMGALVHAIAEHLAASRIDSGGPLPAVR